jgi:DNA-binding MarR family transcriptional regulator
MCVMSDQPMDVPLDLPLDHRWLDERESRAWRGLQFMHMQLDAALARDLAADSSLSIQDYAVLVALTDEPDASLRAFELADLLGWDKTRLSHHIKRMVARGLVSKQVCPSDRRGFDVAITDAGRRAIEAAAPGHVATVRRLFIDLLTDDELDVIERVSTRVLGALDASS